MIRAALALALLLGGCASASPVEPDPNVPKQPDAAAIAECKAKGGEIRPAGLMGTPTCIIPYKDAGKDCTEDTDCEGQCWASSVPPPGPDGKMHGICQANNLPFGCHAVIDHGAVQGGGVLCVD